MRSRYISTCVELRSREDLRPLTRALKRLGLSVLLDDYVSDAEQMALLEAHPFARTPKADIATMLKAIESLKPAARAIWDRCRRRDFNIGYECGDSPRFIDQGVPRRSLERMAKLGLSLRVSLYRSDPQRRKKKAGASTET